MLTTEYLGSSPFAEDCAQVGSDGYGIQAKKECRAFINQIRRYYELPINCRLKISSNPHDFGSYYSVDFVYEEDNAESMDAFLAIEGDKENRLEYWDDEAKQELGID